MKYDRKTLIDLLKPADVILKHGSHSVISKLIRVVTDSYWNHAIMYIGDKKYIESEYDGGVRIRDLDNLIDKDIEIYRNIYVKNKDIHSIVSSALKYEGKNYDYMAILELIWLYVSGRRGHPLKVGSDNRFICSELVAKAYNDAGFIIRNSIPTNQITPQDFDLSKYFVRIRKI